MLIQYLRNVCTKTLQGGGGYNFLGFGHFGHIVFSWLWLTYKGKSYFSHTDQDIRLKKYPI